MRLVSRHIMVSSSVHKAGCPFVQRLKAGGCGGGLNCLNLSSVHLNVAPTKNNVAY